jgi:hypothetical protein
MPKGGVVVAHWPEVVVFSGALGFREATGGRWGVERPQDRLTTLEAEDLDENCGN